MPEVINVYRQSVPAMRFVGKKYGDEDRVNGTFGARWDEWFQNSWFNILEKEQSNLKEDYVDSDAYVGLMRYKEGEPFQYWIGIF